MKLFHTENGKEKVYVQMQDIMYLNQSDMPIPASIYTKVVTGVTIVDNSNRFDFVSFDEEHEVKFFRDKKGDSFFIPAGFGKYEICGKCEIIVTNI